MSILMSNELALSNPIPDELQRDYLSDYGRILYCIEITEDNLNIDAR